MAPKRSSPLDDPPSASSSSSSSSTSSSGAESEKINGHEEQEQEQTKGIAESEEEEEESGDEEEEEEEEVENKTPPPVQTPTPTATPQPQSSSDSEGSDSEDSGGTRTSPTASDFSVKPITSKPMGDSSTKHKKPTLESPKSGAKRPAESEEKKAPQKKKGKVAANGDEKGGVVEEKKSAINRLWSEDDEIVVLKGMIDFQKKKGPISHADMGAFLDFITKSLHVDVSKNQLVEKVRRLKKKYWSSAMKGEEPVFSKPHDIKCLELAKKIWGGGGGSSNAFVEGVKSNGRKARKSVKASNSPKEEEQQLALQNGLNGEVKEGLNGEVKDMKVGEEDFCSLYPYLQGSLERYANLSEAGRNFIKGSMSLIGSVKAKELEEKWKKFREDEVALYLQELEFIQEQTKLILEAVKSSNS